MTIIAIVLVIFFTVSGNLLLKVGAGMPGLSDSWPLSLINLRTIAGMVSFGFAFLGYLTLLQRMPLNLAQAIFSIQFVAVIISSALILHEPIGVVRWLGIGLILLGIATVATTATKEI